MVKRIGILGSTGSIGTSALRVIDALNGREDKEVEYRVAALSGHRNVELLAEQVRKYRPGVVAITDGVKSEGFEKLVEGVEVEVLRGSEGKRPEVTYGKAHTAAFDINKWTARKKGEEAVIEAFLTSKPDALYAIWPNWPGDSFTVKDVTTSAETVVTMLGVEEPLKFAPEGSTVTVMTPRVAPDQFPYQYGYTFKLTNVK